MLFTTAPYFIHLNLVPETRSSHLGQVRCSDTAWGELEAAGLRGVAVHSQADCLTVRRNQSVPLKHSSPVVRYIFCFNHSLLLIEKKINVKSLNTWCWDAVAVNVIYQFGVLNTRSPYWNRILRLSAQRFSIRLCTVWELLKIWRIRIKRLFWLFLLNRRCILYTRWYKLNLKFIFHKSVL